MSFVLYLEPISLDDRGKRRSSLQSLSLKETIQWCGTQVVSRVLFVENMILSTERPLFRIANSVVKCSKKS